MTLTFDPKINGFPRLMVEHFYVKFGDSNCFGFWVIIWKTETDRHTNGGENGTPVTAAGVGNKSTHSN